MKVDIIVAQVNMEELKKNASPEDAEALTSGTDMDEDKMEEEVDEELRIEEGV